MSVVAVSTVAGLMDAVRRDHEILIEPGVYEIEERIIPSPGQILRRASSLRPVIDGHDEVDFGIDCDKNDRWKAAGVTIEGLEVVRFTESGIRPYIDGIVRHNRVIGCKRNGIGAGLERAGGVLVERNEVSLCGNPDELGSDSSGMKFAGTGKGTRQSGAIIQFNHVHDNVGNGIWLDVNCSGDQISRNTVERNTRKGIFYEISAGPCRIARNTVTGNCTEGRIHADAGIVVVNSKNTYIFANELLANNGRAIQIRQDTKRLQEQGEGYQLSGILLEQNDPNGEEIKGCELAGVTCG